MNALAITRTAGPWVVKQLDAHHWCVYDAEGIVVATNLRSEANAHAIAKSCNAHDDLIAALRLIERQAAADGNALIGNYARAARAKAGALVNREQYNAARRAAFQAQRMMTAELKAAEYADSPGWARNYIQARYQATVERVPSPFSWREHNFEMRMRTRRQRVLDLVHERQRLAKYPNESTWCDRLTRELREAFRCWRNYATPIERAPLPQDRAPAQPNQLRRAA